MKGRRSARKCTPFLNTSIPCKTALGLSWNTACVRARCAVFFTGGYTEVCLLFTGPDGFPQPGYYKLDDIGKKLFYTAAEAAALAKSMTEKYERTWGWIGAPEIPMARPWEKLLEVPANG